MVACSVLSKYVNAVATLVITYIVCCFQMISAIRTLANNAADRQQSSKKPVSLSMWLKKGVTVEKSPKKLTITPKKTQVFVSIAFCGNKLLLHCDRQQKEMSASANFTILY